MVLQALGKTALSLGASYAAKRVTRRARKSLRRPHSRARRGRITRTAARTFLITQASRRKYRMASSRYRRYRK